MLYKLIRPFTSAYKKARTLYYHKIVPAARQPVFYEAYGVADDYDGRFNMLALHFYLVLEQLKARREEDKSCAVLEQELVDIFFDDMDTVVRERGTGDMGVGHKVKKLANRFYGRFKAYEEARTEDALAAAFIRNIYRDEEKATQAARLAAYVMKTRTALSAQPLGRLLADPDWPDA